ncbi:MAG: DUF2637 domain-containing protein [Anaerolineae bacterium]|nr:DUF2637 domain-containing protein [Anaerolineae bacterium]
MTIARQASPKNVDTVKLISSLAALLVGLLAIGAFTISYTSLRHLANVYGIDPQLTWLWPLLLDFAMIVFSLAVLRANLRDESALYPWLLTGIYAGLATIANVLDVTGLGIPQVAIAAAVKALAPVSLVLAFELLMGMIRAELRRSNVINSIKDLTAEAEHDRQAMKMQQQEQQREIERLIAEQERLQTGLTDLQNKKAELETEITGLRKQKREEERQFLQIGDDTRDRARAILAERPGISGAALGRELGRSDSLGRKLKRELSPIISANGNHKQE